MKIQKRDFKTGDTRGQESATLKDAEFTITENGKIVDLTGKDSLIYNRVKRGDIEGVKTGAGTRIRADNRGICVLTVYQPGIYGGRGECESQRVRGVSG